MKFLYLILFTVIPYSDTEDYEEIADRITYTVAEKVKKEKKLYVSGTGGGMMNSIQCMGMDFKYFCNNITINQGRELLMYCIDEYLYHINNNIMIRPFLKTYPFKNVEIAIFIEPDPPIGAIAVVLMG